MHPKLKALIETGIPVEEAFFHSAVNNGDKVPQNNFSIHSNDKGRVVEMWDTPAGLVCRHNGLCFRVPEPNIKFLNYRPEEALDEAQEAKPGRRSKAKPTDTSLTPSVA